MLLIIKTYLIAAKMFASILTTYFIKNLWVSFIILVFYKVVNELPFEHLHKFNYLKQITLDKYIDEIKQVFYFIISYIEIVFSNENCQNVKYVYERHRATEYLEDAKLPNREFTVSLI